MYGRFKCSKCSGTLDSCDSRFPPTCPNHIGTMKMVGQALKLLDEPTGCKMGGGKSEDPRLNEFLNRGPFQWNHFVPYTGRGKFDCHFDPRQGILKITVRFSHLAPAAKIHPVTKETIAPEPGLSSRELLKVEQDFKESIVRYWNGKCRFQCTKPGWNNVVATPKFEVVFGSTTDAHFRLTVSKERKESKQQYERVGMRECRGFVSLNQITSGDTSVQDTVTMRDFQVKDFNLRMAISGISQTERMRLEAAITTADMRKATMVATDVVGNVAFDADSAVLTIPATTKLTAFATEVNKQMPGTRPVPIQVKGYHLGTEIGIPKLAQDRAAAVEKLLKRLGIPNPIVVRPVQAGTAAEVEITLDRIFEDRQRDEGAYLYNVAAHEFGHMLGLPDEYENPVATMGDVETQAKAMVKKRFIELAGFANVPSPMFPSHTSSLMSDGMESMSWHFVTLWNALWLMTRDYVEPDEWLIYVPH